MSTSEPPTQTPIVTDQDGYLDIQWVLFFNQVFNGDAGDAWIPTFEGLSGTGVPTFTGRVYRLSQYIALFVARITPAPGGNVSGTAGSYFIDNFPLQMAADGICAAVSGNVGTVTGMTTADQNRIYPPTLSAVTNPVTIMGIVEIVNKQ